MSKWLEYKIVNEAYLLNFEFKLIAWLVLKFDKSNFNKEQHPLNTLKKNCTLLVFIFEIFIVLAQLQFRNISVVWVFFSPLNFETSKQFKE